MDAVSNDNISPGVDAEMNGVAAEAVAESTHDEGQSFAHSQQEASRGHFAVGGNELTNGGVDSAVPVLGDVMQAIAASASAYKIPNSPDATAHHAAAGNVALTSSITNDSANNIVMQAGAQHNIMQHQQETHVDQSSTNPRQTMDTLLESQKQALLELAHAEEDLNRAQQRLANAKRQKLSIDERINAAAESQMEVLLSENNRWNTMYKRLADYKREHGHCHVKRSSRKNGSTEKDNNLQSLGSWIGQVRLDARRPLDHPQRLEPFKILALDKLGFDWEPRENYWMHMYEQLKLYLEKSGGKMPPRVIRIQKFALGQWVRRCLLICLDPPIFDDHFFLTHSSLLLHIFSNLHIT